MSNYVSRTQVLDRLENNVSRYEYRWAEGPNTKTPVQMPAAEYIDHLMTWIENQLNNEKLFPCQVGKQNLNYLITLGVNFPDNFQSLVKIIFKRLFRVYAHIYHSHFKHVMSLGLESHLNTCFKHFIYFVDEFKLVDSKDLAPLAELIQEFKLRKKGQSN
jgi:MOB kinase activator 1